MERRGINPQCPEFRKTFLPGVRADIGKIIEENPMLEETVKVLRQDPGHIVETIMDEQGDLHEYISRVRREPKEVFYGSRE